MLLLIENHVKYTRPKSILTYHRLQSEKGKDKKIKNRMLMTLHA